MYGFVLVPDCIIHFINVLITERAKRAIKKYRYVAAYHCQCCLVSDCRRHYNYVLPYKKAIQCPSTENIIIIGLEQT